jgi:Tfp pilus assembly protein FimT
MKPPYTKNQIVNPRSSLPDARRQAGFTLLETLLVASVMMAAVAVAVPTITSAIANSRVETALQNVVQELRLARQSSMDSRRIHVISFTLPGRIAITRRETDGSTTPVREINLPSEVQFYRNSVASEPDQLTTTGAISFNGASSVSFRPDGSAVDAGSQICNGVVYIARPGDVESTRAVTLFGATGRVKGFRYKNSGGSWLWQ